MSKEMPRIQVQIDEDLKHRVLVKAVNEKKTIKQIVHKLLIDWLENDKQGS